MAPSRQAAAESRRPGSGRTGWSRAPPGASRSESGVRTWPSSGVEVSENGVEHRLDPGEVAVRVVVGRALAELRDPAGQVGRVRADVLDDGLRLLERLDRAREGDARALGEQRLLLRQVDQVVARPLLLDQEAEVADRRLGVGHERPQRPEERRQVLRGRLRLGDEHVEVAQRRAQVHERRVRLAEGGRKQPERTRERGVLVADRPRGRVRVRDEVGQVVAALGDRPHDRGRIDDEALEALVVADQLARSAAMRSRARG